MISPIAIDNLPSLSFSTTTHHHHLCVVPRRAGWTREAHSVGLVSMWIVQVVTIIIMKTMMMIIIIIIMIHNIYT